MPDRKLLLDALHDAAKEWEKPTWQELKDLLLTIREELARDPTLWAAELINEIDAVLGEVE